MWNLFSLTIKSGKTDKFSLRGLIKPNPIYTRPQAQFPYGHTKGLCQRALRHRYFLSSPFLLFLFPFLSFSHQPGGGLTAYSRDFMSWGQRWRSIPQRTPIGSLIMAWWKISPFPAANFRNRRPEPDSPGPLKLSKVPLV